MEGVAVERLAQRLGTGERCDERHPRRVASGRAARLVGVPM